MRILQVVCVAAIVAALGSAAMAVDIVTVPVGNPGNTGELSGSGAGGTGPDGICGAVDYWYRIGKYEVTAGQYTEFLNAVAKTDPKGLYNTQMWSNKFGCKIERTGSSGSYSYSVASERAVRPVNFVSWYDAARFSNWLHNGQPTGAQGVGTTENGSYDMSLGSQVVRKSDATWVLPTEDEWYKAAYHKNDGVTGNYWDYPTASDTMPTSEAPPGTDLVNGSANYYDDDVWIDSTYWTTPVGAYTAKPSDSAYGTFGQAGNILEWNETMFDYGMFRGRRGGSFYVGYSMKAEDRARDNATLEEYTVGFRVAEVPEPVTLSLLAFGGLTLIRRKK